MSAPATAVVVWTAPYPLFRLGNTTHSARCERCAWAGPERLTWMRAQADADAHSIESGHA